MFLYLMSFSSYVLELFPEGFSFLNFELKELLLQISPEIPINSCQTNDSLASRRLLISWYWPGINRPHIESITFFFHRSSNLAKKNKNKNWSYSFNSVPSESTHQWDWVEWLLGHWHQTFTGQRHAVSPVPLHAFFIHLSDGDWHYMLCLHASLYSDRSLKSGCLHVSNGS